MIRYRNRTEFHRWLALFKKQNWLIDYPDSLDELKRMCEDASEEDLVCDLIERIHFVTADEKAKLLSDIALQITQRWKLGVSETMIVATTIDNDADSAQYIAYSLENHLQKNNWFGAKIFNNFGKCCRIDCLSKYKNVVFIDEFIGSGTTILNRIKQFKGTVNEHYQNGSIVFRDHSVKVCVLACMEHSKPLILDEGVDLFAALWLKKGIAGHYPIENRFRAYRAILRLERKLDRSKDKNKIFPCGYKKSEALYKMDEGSAVNNMFPIFWWPYAIEERRRQTLFNRKGK